jgi:hypothetical protein
MPFTFKSFDAVGLFSPVGVERLNGSVFVFDVPKSKVTMQWSTAGDASHALIHLELSLDGVNFFDTGNNVGLSGVVTFDQHIIVAARASISSFTGGPGDAALTAIIGVEPTETAISITQS